MRENFFNWEIERKVGNGGSTRFWKAVCVGDFSLKVCFPCLYSLSTQKGSNISLFLHCQVALKVWRKVMCWIRINLITP